MRIQRSTVAAISLSFLVLFSTAVFAQTEPQRPPIVPSSEATLQLIVGSNDAAQSGNLPAELRAVASRIKSDFGFTSYRLDNTFVGRIGGIGNFEYRSVSNTIGTGADSDSPSFLEWNLGLRNSANENGRMTFQVDSFRFGAKIPVKVSTMVGDAGKIVSNTVYENVGVSISRVSLPENTPTLIGTLSLPKTAGTIFLVLTIKPA